MGTCTMSLRRSAQLFFRASRTARFAEEAVPVNAKLILNFNLPHKSIMNGKEVDEVTIPGGDGVMGVVVEHQPAVTQMEPGVVTVYDGGEPQKWFVAGGFAFVHADSTCDIAAVEAVPLEHLDETAAREGLKKYQADVNAATDDVERAYANIGVDVHEAMIDAL